MDVQAQNQLPPQAWNLGRIIGPKPPLKPKHICAIRTRLLHEGELVILQCSILRSTASYADAISCAFASVMSSSEVPFASERPSSNKRPGGRAV